MSRLEEKLAEARMQLATRPLIGAPLSDDDDALRRVLLEDLEAAFGEVRRDGGIGPREARALDDYALEEERALARAADCETRWQDLPDEVLLYADTALSFADAAGRRFLLPAFIRFALSHPRGDFILGEYAVIFLTKRGPGELAGELRLDAAQLRFLARFLAFAERLWPGCPDEQRAVEAWQKPVRGA